MNKVLEFGINLLQTIGKSWAFIGRSVTFSVSRGSYAAVESFVNVLINTTCFVGLIVTFPGVVIFTAVGLPADLVILTAGGIIEGCTYLGEAIEHTRNWHAATIAAREAAQQERDAVWERRKPTILSRVFIAQALKANGAPLDVADMFTRNIHPSYPNAPKLTDKDIELLSENNRAMIFTVYHAKNRHVVIEMDNATIELEGHRVLP